MGATGHLFVGDDGKILSQRLAEGPGYWLIPESRAKEYGDPPRVLAKAQVYTRQRVTPAAPPLPGAAG